MKRASLESTTLPFHTHDRGTPKARIPSHFSNPQSCLDDLTHPLLTVSSIYGASEGSIECAIEGVVSPAHQPQEIPQAAGEEGAEARFLQGSDHSVRV